MRKLFLKFPFHTWAPAPKIAPKIHKKHFFRIKHVFLIGETKFLYKKYLKNFLDCTIVKNLEEAVKLSYFLAQKKIKKEKEKVTSSIVLLSPACSSLDEWRDFEERGNAFIKFVKKI